MKEKIKTTTLIILISLLIIVGLFVGFKPTIDNKVNESKQEEIKQAVLNGETEIQINLPEDNEDDYDLYNFDDFSSPYVTPVPVDYDKNNVKPLGILEIPSIKLAIPVVEGTERRKIKVALGQLMSEKTVNAGETGNCIIAGHRCYTKGKMFNKLEEVDIGQFVIFTDTTGNVYKYEVYKITVIDVGDDSLFDYKDGQKKLTLITCTEGATHRLLVQCRLVE